MIAVRYEVTLEEPRFWLSSLGWILGGIFEIISSIVLLIVLSMFGLVIIGIIFLFIGIFLAIRDFRRARKCMKFYCERCDKKIVAYKYEYTVMCKRCRACHDIVWEE